MVAALTEFDAEGSLLLAGPHPSPHGLDAGPPFLLRQTPGLGGLASTRRFPRRRLAPPGPDSLNKPLFGILAVSRQLPEPASNDNDPGGDVLDTNCGGDFVAPLAPGSSASEDSDPALPQNVVPAFLHQKERKPKSGKRSSASHRARRAPSGMIRPFGKLDGTKHTNFDS